MNKHTALSPQDQWKKEAAIAAAAQVTSGMVVGLGTGSTAKFAIDEIGRRVAQQGLRIIGIATSERSAEHAQSLKIPLTSFSQHTRIDLTIDGADEVLPGALYLIKGHGGALLREKIVAAASVRMAVVVDRTKIVKKLGQLVSVPTEVVPFGWEVTERRLAKIGGKPKLRRAPDGSPYVTDGGHYILDCAFGAMNDPWKVCQDLDQIVGVVENGLFLEYATEVFVGSSDGVEVLKKSHTSKTTKNKISRPAHNKKGWRR
jgi:ribose 5-phosphate isomerase A